MAVDGDAGTGVDDQLAGAGDGGAGHVQRVGHGDVAGARDRGVGAVAHVETAEGRGVGQAQRAGARAVLIEVTEADTRRGQGQVGVAEALHADGAGATDGSVDGARAVEEQEQPIGRDGVTAGVGTAPADLEAPGVGLHGSVVGEGRGHAEEAGPGRAHDAPARVLERARSGDLAGVGRSGGGADDGAGVGERGAGGEGEGRTAAVHHEVR